MDARKGIPLRTQQALEDRGMLRIDRQDGRLIPAGLRHDDRAGRNQRFLVGQGNDLAGTDGRKGRCEAAEPNHGRHDDIHPVRRDQVAHGADAGEDLDPPVLERIGYLPVFAFVADDGVVDIERKRLLDQGTGTVVGRDQFHFEQIRMLAHHIQGLTADGAGRAQDGDSSLVFHSFRNLCIARG